MTYAIVGTAGHIDHGKTALVKALTGTDADRLPEEKRRGITVDIGFAEMEAGGKHFGFVDVPGHEKFVKNMLAGASGIDVVLLVIAADDGVMPQTREHFDICRLLGVRTGVIAITKTDLVDADTLELAKLDAAELVAGSFLEEAPVIAVSSVAGSGLEKLREALTAAAVERDEGGLIARLPIDRSFSMKGFGTVVTGTLASGSISEGDEMELMPAGRRLRVRGLQSHGQAVQHVHAGQRVAVNLAGIDHADITRGMMLAEPGVLRPTQMIDASVEVLADTKRALRSRQRVRLHIGTAEVLTRVRVLNTSGEIAAGASGFVQLSLESPVATISGERFIIRSYSPQTTIAGGMVIDHAPSRHRAARFAEVTSQLEGYRRATFSDARLRLLIEGAGKRGVTSDDIRARTGWSRQSFDAALDQLLRTGEIVKADEILIISAEIDELRSSTLAAVTSFHKRRPLERGLPREELRDLEFWRMPGPVFEYVLRRLAAEGKIIAEGEAVRSADFSYDLSAEERKASDSIRSALLAAGLEVPKIGDLLAQISAHTGLTPQKTRRLLQILLDSREVVKVNDDLSFAKATMEELIAKIRNNAESTTDRSIDVARFKEIAGVSRKYAIPLLEYFDRNKITVRRGDTRVVL